MALATSATSVTPNNAPTNDQESPGMTPKSIERMSWAPAMARGTPAATPATLISKLSRKTIQRTAMRSERHAHADLGCAAAHAIGQRAVEARGHQERGEQTEEHGEPGEQARLRKRFVELRALGHGLFDRKVGIEVVEDGPNAWYKRFGVSGGVQLDLHIGNGAALPKREVQHGPGFFIDARIFAVGSDSDDCEPVVELDAAGGVTQRVAFRKKTLHESFVDDHDFRRGTAVGVQDIAAFEDRNSQRVEIIGADFVRAHADIRKVAWGNDPIDGVDVVVAPAGTEAILHQGCRLNARDHAQAVEENLVEAGFFVVGVGGQRACAEDEKSIGAEA